MKIGGIALSATLAIGLGSSCAHAQAADAAQPLPTAAQTTSGTTATFTAIVAATDTSAGTITLTQTLPTAGILDAVAAPTATASYLADALLINQASVGAIVQATVQWVSGRPAVTTLETADGAVSAVPKVATTNGSVPTMLTPSLAGNPMVSNPARLTPAGAE